MFSAMIGAVARRMLIGWSGAISPDQFAQGCKQIVQKHEGHRAHREIDLLTNQVLCSLGYGEGLRVFLTSSSIIHGDDE